MLTIFSIIKERGWYFYQFQELEATPGFCAAGYFPLLPQQSGSKKLNFQNHWSLKVDGISEIDPSVPTSLMIRSKHRGYVNITRVSLLPAYMVQISLSMLAVLREQIQISEESIRNISISSVIISYTIFDVGINQVRAFPFLGSKAFLTMRLLLSQMILRIKMLCTNSAVTF